MDPDGVGDYEPDDSDGEAIAEFEMCSPSYPDFGMSSGEIERHIEQLDAALVLKEEKQADLQEGLWYSIPEDILWNVLMRLPMVSRCRYRCVSSKWNMLLSTPYTGQHLGHAEARPSCTIMCNAVKYVEDCFFCHGEKRWFRIPKPSWCRELQWIPVATDEGLLCYESFTKGCSWLLVCNPLTGSFRVLSYNFPQGDSLSFQAFIVDRATKTYKVILMSTTETLVFDSKTEEWKVCKSSWEALPDLPSPNCGEDAFVYNNLCCRRASYCGNRFAFNLESGLWSEIDMDLPCNTGDWYYLGGSKDQMILVQLDPRDVDPVRIWKLDTTLDSPDLSALKWEKIPVEVPASMRPLIAEFESCKSHGYEYIFFTLCGSSHWIKYCLRTRTWNLMPYVGKREFGLVSARFDWFVWEPQIDMDVEPGNFLENETLMLMAALREESDDSDFPPDSSDDDETEDDASEDSEDSQDSDSAFDEEF